MLHFLWDSISFQTFLIFLTVFLLIADYMKQRKPKNYPPSPFSLPFVGHIYLMNFKNPWSTVEKLAEKYGNIFSIQIGGISNVFINGPRMVKEVLVNQGENFLDRPETPLSGDMFNKKGLIFSNGLLWKQHRRFTLTTLRNLGLGKRGQEECIQEECQYLVDAFGEEQGNPFNPHLKINHAVSNIICCFVFGNRFEYHDKDFQRLLQLVYETVELHGNIMSQLYAALPSIIKFLPGSHHTIMKNWRSVRSFIDEKIDKHKENQNPSESQDFIDSYLQEIAKDNGSDTFQENHLAACVMDLVFAGTETTSTTLRWALLYMAMYPEIQARVHAEIDRVIGQGRLPALEDRNNMPYTNAVIHEVQRKSNIIPFNVPREAVKDTVLDGFHIPKGTTVVANLTSVMFDKEEWETPNTFNPGHFLKDGQFCKKESFVPFSLGKRACLGEVLARSELFLFFVSLLQKFTFQPPPDTTLTLQFRMSMTLAPHPYKICAVPR
ncbi:cytochrome P450 2J2 [Colius striatus]|uniref:cytochrome P450 2J2 n=1 Tax=Colius striatus TaxID=57412 RepID=UPI002B1E7CD2|nr:cytochrome P450 2J2 [Colius striatus]